MKNFYRDARALEIGRRFIDVYVQYTAYDEISAPPVSGGDGARARTPVAAGAAASPHPAAQKLVMQCGLWVWRARTAARSAQNAVNLHPVTSVMAIYEFNVYVSSSLSCFDESNFKELDDDARFSEPEQRSEQPRPRAPCSSQFDRTDYSNQYPARSTIPGTCNRCTCSCARTTRGCPRASSCSSDRSVAPRHQAASATPAAGPCRRSARRATHGRRRPLDLAAAQQRARGASSALSRGLSPVTV